jgi:hypothetical protein
MIWNWLDGTRMEKVSVKTFPCEHCGAILCDRQGNVIVVGNLEVELTRSRNIKCVLCGGHTRFAVARGKYLLLNNGNCSKD